MESKQIQQYTYLDLIITLAPPPSPHLVGLQALQGVATVFVPVEVLAWRTHPTPAIIIFKIFRYFIHIERESRVTS